MNLAIPQENYRTAIITEGIIKDLVKNLRRNNDELQMHCASAIFKVLALLPCAEVLATFIAVKKEIKQIQLGIM